MLSNHAKTLSLSADISSVKTSIPTQKNSSVFAPCGVSSIVSSNKWFFHSAPIRSYLVQGRRNTLYQLMSVTKSKRAHPCDDEEWRPRMLPIVQARHCAMMIIVHVTHTFCSATCIQPPIPPQRVILTHTLKDEKKSFHRVCQMLLGNWVQFSDALDA